MRICSGTVPYRLHEGVIQVCIVRSTAGDRWVFPKGGVEPGLSKKSNAIKETWEEAGLIGRIGKYLGRVENNINRSEYFTFSAVLTETTYPETHRAREWIEVNQARVKLCPSLHFLLDELLNKLA